jgi:hypothetical protein
MSVSMCLLCLLASLASFAWHCFALENVLALIASLAWLVILAFLKC